MRPPGPPPRVLAPLAALALAAPACFADPDRPDDTAGATTGSTTAAATVATSTAASTTGDDTSTTTGAPTTGAVMPPDCDPPFSVCGVQCVDLAADPANCGECGVTCVIPHAAPACG